MQPQCGLITNLSYQKTRLNTPKAAEMANREANKAKAISAELFELNLKVQLFNSVIV